MKMNTVLAMYEARNYDDVDVWLMIEPYSIDIIDSHGNFMVRYDTTVNCFAAMKMLQ